MKATQYGKYEPYEWQTKIQSEADPNKFLSARGFRCKRCGEYHIGESIKEAYCSCRPRFWEFIRGVTTFRSQDFKWRFQLQYPRLSMIKKDYYIMLPTVVRVILGSPDDNFPFKKNYGFGIVILGFGFAVTYTENEVES